MGSMIQDLKHPDSLPDSTKQISVVQTHISIVFVADRFVYKVKKPVNFGFLDFSTLEKRRFFCEQEITLNRRLSKDLYIGVLPIKFDGSRYRVGEGPGNTVEYAVKMKRIPEEKLMKRVFERGELSGGHLKRISEVLAHFHLNALRSAEIDQFGMPEKFRVNTDENFHQVERYKGETIQAEDFEALKKWTERFYRVHYQIFLKRVEAGKIRDCHGDLHMEHICLTEDLPIFDCIEFNDRFRYSDTVADLAFLLMDLEFHSGADHARKLWNAYKKLTGEKGVDALLTFYKVYRAFVRGKVNSFQLEDQEIPAPEKERAAKSASRYFKLALSYIQ